jgi:hypothetical protein
LGRKYLTLSRNFLGLAQIDPFCTAKSHPHASTEKKGKTMKIGALVIAAALALPALPATAGPISLSGDELREAISGKAVYLNISGFELPIRYSPNGRMSGTMGAVAASFARGDGASDRGKWWVASD